MARLPSTSAVSFNAPEQQKNALGSENDVCMVLYNHVLRPLALSSSVLEPQLHITSYRADVTGISGGKRAGLHVYIKTPKTRLYSCNLGLVTFM